MKKILLTLGIVLSALSFYSCGKTAVMSDKETFEFAKELVKDNINTDENKIISISLSEKTLKNRLLNVYVDYVDKDNKIYNAVIDAETKKLWKEPSYSNRNADYNLIEGIKLDEISIDTLQKYENQLLNEIPEEFKFKSFGSIEISRKVDIMTESMAKSMKFKKYPADALEYDIIARIVKKTGSTKTVGRMSTTSYYEVICRVDYEGNVEIEDY